ncbi:Ran-binding-domain-containing protein [Sporormia fimetaria CBS 119925]|uniref:Ran-binding-domain-containing protein n=1 Tax=Sporormia fimetaria CBS 119925 TaxID=1340428 RepID=A0A6A6V0E5_9PLEO|nr:Ran-binding-domain-containing protein [Sporormia fimetaria CBS 119925]
MEFLLAKVTQQAMNYAIKSGMAITCSYAMRNCGRLLKTVDGKEKEELAGLQLRLEGKIRVSTTGIIPYTASNRMLQIISPAIDMIELIAARGNTSLESAVILTKSLRCEIQALGSRLALAAGEGMLARKSKSATKQARNEKEVKEIISDIRRLLERIEDAVPLINLAITTSGVNLSTSLPATVSPSRLLQASTFLSAGDTQYCMMLPRAQQIGPAFTLSLYMLFAGHTNRPHDEEGIRETTWKEVMHKATVKLVRVPLRNVYDYPTPFGGDTRQADEAKHAHMPSESRLNEFAYQLLVIEDLDDDRVHTFEDDEPQPTYYEGVNMAGVREIIPIHEISKIFYADTGKILNIGTEGETNNPILLLKRDLNAVPPRRMEERAAAEPDYDSDDTPAGGHPDDLHAAGESEKDDDQAELDAQLRRESTANLETEPKTQPEEPVDTHPWRLPPNLDLEWMAFEVYTEDPPSDFEDFDESELDLPSTASTPQPSSPASQGLATSLSRLNLSATSPISSPLASNSALIPSPQKAPILHSTAPPPPVPAIKTSLSLLEMLIRLTALQQFQQASHLAIPDELLTFFLSESATVGAGNDSELRRRVRREARMRVGFDPYDESPIKRRGEEYLEHEFHDHHDLDEEDPVTPNGRRGFDYDGYPRPGTSSPRSQSRGSTPSRTQRYPQGSSPLPGASSPSARTRSMADASLPLRDSHGLGMSSSASPLLRRATTQPRMTGLPASSSPRVDASRQRLPGTRTEPQTPPNRVG